MIEGFVLKISGHSRQEEVVPCEGGSQGHKAVAVLADKPMAPRLPNSGIRILIDKSFPHLAHHGAGSLALDLEGGVAQDLLDLPTIQTSSDGMSVNFNPPLLICGGVEEGFFNHGFGRSSFRIRMLFPSELMLYRSSRCGIHPREEFLPYPKRLSPIEAAPPGFPLAPIHFHQHEW